MAADCRHPTTRAVLLILAGAQAMIGAFVLGLAVNIGTSALAPGQYPDAMVAGRDGELVFTFNAGGGAGGVGRFRVPR